MPDVIATGEQNINSPLPLDYPYIRAYAILHGWPAKAAAEALRRARDQQAPQTAVFYGRRDQPGERWRWSLFDEFSLSERNRMLAEITLGL